MNYEDYEGDENDISMGNFNLDTKTMGKNNIPVKLHIKKQEVYITIK